MTRRMNSRIAGPLGAAAVMVLMAGSPAMAQSGTRAKTGGQRQGQPARSQPAQTQPAQSQPAQTTNQTTNQPASGTRSNGGRRAPGGGVRAPGGGVRGPGGSVRGPGTPGAGTRGTPSTSGPGAPGGPVDPGPGGNPGGGPGHGGGHYCFPYYGWPWGGYWGWGWYTIPQRYAGTVDGPNTQLQGGEAEPEPLTPLETARYWMAAEDSSSAAAWYRGYLDENPDDARVMREYASALLEEGRTVDAVAMMGYAYSLMPGLANEAMDRAIWGDSAFRLRDSVTDAVRFGHRSSSGNAWLLVAVLMQAEGRDQVALKMIDRAVGEGLDVGIADRMRLRLTQR